MPRSNAPLDRALRAEHAQHLCIGGKEQRRAVVQKLLVGLERPQELVEARILSKRTGVDARGFRIAFGLEALRLSVRLRFDVGPLAIRLGDNPARLELAKGAVLLGHLAPLRLHALEHVLAVLLRQAQMQQLHVDDLDAVG